MQFGFSRSLSPLESSEEGLTHQKCPELEQENTAFIPPQQICGLPEEAGAALGKAAVFSRVSPAGRWQYKCNSRCVIRLLISFFPTASFYGESYVGLNIIEVSSELSLQLKFQTSKPQGLLFLQLG